MESPVMGWLIPYSWQEPGYGDDFDSDESEIDDEVDSKGRLTIED